MSGAGNKYEALARLDISGGDDSDGDVIKEQMRLKPPRSPGPDENRLQFAYSLWFTKRSPPGGSRGGSLSSPSDNYAQKVKLIGSFSTVEQFWAFYSHTVRPSQAPGNGDFHIFKYGIKPMWEDENNRNGGKWIVRLKKGMAARAWENVVLAMLGEQFMVGGEICGAVVSLRFQEEFVSVWNRCAEDVAVVTRIRDTLRRILNLPSNVQIEYKKHTDSMRDNSSFFRSSDSHFIR